MSAMQRRKGASYEREVANELNDLLGPVVRRCWEQAQVSGCDLEMPVFAPELKRYGVIGKVYDWMAQAVLQAFKVKKIPIVICRADGKESLVIMRLPDFVKLAREEIVGCKE